MHVRLVDLSLRDMGNKLDMVVQDEKGHTIALEWSLDDAQRIARFTEILIRAGKSDAERF